MASQAPLLIIDFDGTLTEVDVGDALCERFAPPSWEEIDRRWLRGELSLPEAQRQMWALVRATPGELRAEARRVGRLRPGAEALFEAAEAGELEIVVASGGFDLYIEPLLGDRLGLVRGRFYNRLVAAGEGGLRPEFPHGELACDRCAVCKGRVVERHLGAGRRVVFCGDGSSDRCAATVAPELFAVRGGVFERHCHDRGVSHVPFDDLGTVLEALRS